MKIFLKVLLFIVITFLILFGLVIYYFSTPKSDTMVVACDASSSLIFKESVSRFREFGTGRYHILSQSIIYKNYKNEVLKRMLTPFYFSRIVIPRGLPSGTGRIFGDPKKEGLVLILDPDEYTRDDYENITNCILKSNQSADNSHFPTDDGIPRPIKYINFIFYTKDDSQNKEKNTHYGTFSLSVFNCPAVNTKEIVADIHGNILLAPKTPPNESNEDNAQKMTAFMRIDSLGGIFGDLPIYHLNEASQEVIEILNTLPTCLNDKGQNVYDFYEIDMNTGENLLGFRQAMKWAGEVSERSQKRYKANLILQDEKFTCPDNSVIQINLDKISGYPTLLFNETFLGRLVKLGSDDTRAKGYDLWGVDSDRITNMEEKITMILSCKNGQKENVFDFYEKIVKSFGGIGGTI